MIVTFALAISSATVIGLAFPYWTTTSSHPEPVTVTTKGSLDCPNVTRLEGWVRPPVTYGHIHMAKTAGTTLNGYLAAHFERVCGHKGYSYDAVQYNKRVNESKRKRVNVAGGPDAVSKVYHPRKFTRGRVPSEISDEIGYQTCDYISQEGSSTIWTRTFQNQRMELHVPCRDPIDHIISQCNFGGKSFPCNGDPRQAVEDCVVGLTRFHMKLTRQPNFSVKCFDYANLSQYLDYMGTILQRRRVETNYAFRSTNRVRNKTNECLWTQPALMHQVRQVLIKSYDYYRFCHKCLGSDDDLLWNSMG